MIPKNLTSLLTRQLISLCLLCIFPCSYAEQEVINLQSDHVTYDYRKGIVRYQGSVYATQGHTHLNAEQMIVYYNQKHKIAKVVAIGKPARYETLLNDHRDTLKASSLMIYYYPLLGKVILQEDAKVEYNQNLFAGPTIYYDMNDKVISSHPKNASRSKVILEPIHQLKMQLK